MLWGEGQVPVAFGSATEKYEADYYNISTELHTKINRASQRGRSMLSIGRTNPPSA